MPILWKNRECLFSEMRFFDEFFDVINGDPFLTLYKTSALDRGGQKNRRRKKVFSFKVYTKVEFYQQKIWVLEFCFYVFDFSIDSID